VKEQIEKAIIACAEKAASIGELHEAVAAADAVQKLAMSLSMVDNVLAQREMRAQPTLTREEIESALGAVLDQTVFCDAVDAVWSASQNKRCPF
jgi:hypothetical protein